MSKTPHKDAMVPDLRAASPEIQINVNRLKLDSDDEITITKVRALAGGIEVRFVRSYLNGTRERQGVAFYEARAAGPYVFKSQLAAH